jgi:FkbM family methyltransferase
MPIREFSYRGSAYKVSCVESDSYQHPSWFSFVDEDSVRNMFWDVKPGERILDVGAGFGSYTLTALAVGAAYVWAWSPQAGPDGIPERNFFADSLALNGWSSRCSIFDTGVFDRSGYLNVDDQSLTSEPRSGNDIIRVETLDDWADRELRSGERIDWLKLDVEGAEVEVLKGGAEFLRLNMPNVLVENHVFKRPNVYAEVKDFLSSSGFREVDTVPYHGVSHSLYVPLG